MISFKSGEIHAISIYYFLLRKVAGGGLSEIKLKTLANLYLEEALYDNNNYIIIKVVKLC